MDIKFVIGNIFIHYYTVTCTRQNKNEEKKGMVRDQTQLKV